MNENQSKPIFCPKCKAKKFIATAHITQEWIIDENENFLDVNPGGDCIDVLHSPNKYDMWECVKCGYVFCPHES